MFNRKPTACHNTASCSRKPDLADLQIRHRCPSPCVAASLRARRMHTAEIKLGEWPADTAVRGDRRAATGHRRTTNEAVTRPLSRGRAKCPTMAKDAGAFPARYLRACAGRRCGRLFSADGNTYLPELLQSCIAVRNKIRTIIECQIIAVKPFSARQGTTLDSDSSA